MGIASNQPKLLSCHGRNLVMNHPEAFQLLARLFGAVMTMLMVLSTQLMHAVTGCAGAEQQGTQAARPDLHRGSTTLPTWQTLRSVESGVQVAEEPDIAPADGVLACCCRDMGRSAEACRANGPLFHVRTCRHIPSFGACRQPTSLRMPWL